MTNIDGLISGVAALQTEGARREFETLLGIRDWARAHLDIDYDEGDRVSIVDAVVSDDPKSGWFHYRECLAVGATGIVKRIGFNTYKKRWEATLVLDYEWSVHRWDGLQPSIKRYWCTNTKWTPGGFGPLSDVDRANLKKRGDRSRHVWHLPISSLAAASGKSHLYTEISWDVREVFANGGR